MCACVVGVQSGEHNLQCTSPSISFKEQRKVLHDLTPDQLQVHVMSVEARGCTQFCYAVACCD